MNQNLNELRYDMPASEWTQALPLGNGSLGAMVFGGVESEVFQLNQESVWSCRERNRLCPEAAKHLSSIREKIFSERIPEAEQEIYEHFLSPASRLGHYEPLCNLTIHFERKIPHYSERWSPERAFKAERYERALNMREAVYSCSFEKDKTPCHREAFISFPDQVMAVRLTSGQEMSLRFELTREDMCDEVKAGDGFLTLSGGGGSSSRFIAMLAAVSLDAGRISGEGNYLFADDTKDVVLFLSGRTDYYRGDPGVWCRDKLAAALSKGYEKIKEDHIADFGRYYDRVELTLPRSGDNDDIVRYFNYGRYLLLSSSRKGSLPANLQGLWNKEFHPSWGSGYTININLQMNYWPAETSALPESHLPLFDLMRKMLPRGQQAAREIFGCRGAVAFHNTDIYGDCAPNESWMPASVWPMGFAWMATHITEHFRFTRDLSFARENFDLLEEASLFFVDFLTEKDGYLVTCPSTSPENTYLLPDGSKGNVCYGAAMDIQILRELWLGLLEVEEALGRSDCGLAKSVRKMLPELPPDRIGSRGQILEWQKEYPEWEPGHRHISHVFGLYPGSTIDVEKTPELAEAAKRTIAERLSAGGGQVGWSRAWLVNLYARLGEGEKAGSHLLRLIHDLTAENLFDLHPALSPRMADVFQIDGNFGGIAGIMEMLVQSTQDELRLLPALPEDWRSEGSIRGVRVRGGKKLDLAWKDGKVTEAVLTDC